MTNSNAFVNAQEDLIAKNLQFNCLLISKNGKLEKKLATIGQPRICEREETEIQLSTVFSPAAAKNRAIQPYELQIQNKGKT